MTSLPTELRQRCEAWLSDDPDPVTRAELSRLLAASDVATLTDAFGGSLEFGTAGLRGILGPGPNRMNRVVVARATAGLCAHLLATVPDARERGVAIGYDGRRMSFEFARDVAEIVAGFGLRAFVFEHVAPTPLVAFAVTDRNAAAGVMVTASHNPPQYNGYKVYWGNGAQIIPPVDQGIAAAIAAVGPVASIPRSLRAAAEASGKLVVLGPDVERRYLDGVRALALHPESPRDLVVAYTALHGVGERLFRLAMAEAGFTHVHSVAAQAEPDGAFPTVAFPNPEEKGAMDLVLALAAEKHADLVIANDPDADRLALAVRTPSGGYQQLSGNEVGQLLAHYTLSEDRGPRTPQRLVSCSIVSSPMLGAIAAAHGARWEQVLTGFKWIANRAMQLEANGEYRFVMGYEEALGYTVGTLVRDKDGISGAAMAADMAAFYRARGKSLLDELEVMARRYALALSEQVSVTKPGADGAAHIRRIMAAVRAAPPREVAGLPVSHILDLATATRTASDGTVETLELPPGDVLALELEGGHRVMLRPSGTEPKIKYYFDLRVPIGDGELVADARVRGKTLLADVVRAFRAIVDAVS
jgi:phosphomannomutase